ncbi:MAG: UDP-galactopyranose mutase [Miltoncostaeaceae bacterium]|nr:UDP-galactopyranose mutase [Miltoncostaeaceae bacterium]
MISGATIVYLSAVDWSAPWHGPQEIARRLGAAGNRVIYVETLAWRRLKAHDARRAAGRLARGLRRRGGGTGPGPGRTPAPGVELVSPLVVPGASSRAARILSRELVKARIRLSPADRPLVLWIYTPSRLTLDLVGAFGEDLVLYHCTQSHRHRPTAPPGTEAVERELIGRAGAVVVDGIELLRERGPLHPHVYRIPSGVDPAPYAGARPPAWAAALRRPVAGYLGSVDHRIDPALIAAVARAHPEWSVPVVGPVTDLDVSELRELPNVLMRDQVPIDAVPGVLAAFDLGLMPYADIPMTRYTYPAKLHQYLAAGLPVAGVPLPDLAELGDLVATGTGREGFVAAAERAMGDGRVDERRAVAAANTWADRLAALSVVLEGHLEGRPPRAGDDGEPLA